MSTETTDEYDRYAPLFALANTRGEDRLKLLGHDMIRLAMRLMVKDGERYAKLISRLSAWPHAGMFKASVNRALADAKRKKDSEDEAEAAVERLAAAAKDGRPRIDEKNPVAVAEAIAETVLPNVVFVDGQWLVYNGQVYVPYEDIGIRSAIQKFVRGGVRLEDGHPCTPDKYAIDRYYDALRNHVFRSSTEARPPTWLDSQPDDPAPANIIACQNGLLNVMTNKMLPSTPRFFTRNGVGFEYEPDPYFADAPREWLKFLESVWPVAEGGKASHDALQEIMGYLLTGSTEYQKIFMILGPPRSGKGTIGRVLTALLGPGNVSNKPADQLGEGFGLESLLGKQLLIVPDLRLGKNSNIGGITGTLLSVSGEDGQSIRRKHRTDFEGKLNSRILLLSNMGLILPDQSGALVSRLFPLVMHTSFIGREDFELEGRLMLELPEIMMWALDGLRRLEARRDERGRKQGFVLTPDGRKQVDDTSRHGSSVHMFLSECCVMGPDKSVAKSDLFKAFEGYTRESDIRNVLDRVQFTKELKPASGYTIEASRRRDGGKAKPKYLGVALKPEYENYQWPTMADEFEGY